MEGRTTITLPARAARARTWALRLLLLLISLSLGVLAAEIALRPSSAGGPRRVESPDLSRYDRFLGWSLIPGARTRMRSPGEFDVAVRINAQGFRADREYSPLPPPGGLRIVAVGDSFTFGNGVEVHQAFPSLLERRLAAEMINLGVPGYGVDQQLLMLESRGLGFQPAVVLLGLHTPDIFRNTNAFHGQYGKPLFRIDPEGRLVLTNVPVPAPGTPRPPRRTGPLDRSRLFHLVWVRLERHGFGGVWDVTEGILRRMAAVSESAGARLVVLLLPPQYAVYGSRLERLSQAHTIGCIAEILRENRIEHLDLTPVLAAQAEREPGELLFYRKDGHFTPAGNEVIAHEVERYLESPG
ncbi:MAG TPA: GDSL-type esterase/lipase family protein [Thermoanaerobaculia bacterium]|nr:GDSL-type esterase/lipase family protein [Thermoanaerobaculia bacterium]